MAMAWTPWAVMSMRTRRLACFSLAIVLLSVLPGAWGEAPFAGSPSKPHKGVTVRGHERHLAKVAEEGGHNGESADSHHEDSEEHELEYEDITDITYTVALLVFLFFFFNFGILYMVNFKDAQIRSYMYKMISTTVSIFCAVLLNQAITGIFLQQILPSPWPRGFKIRVTFWIKFSVHVAFFLIFFMMLNFLCFFSKKHRKFLHAIRTVGGHLTAFAGIAAFGHLQHATFIRESQYAVFMVMVTVFLIFHVMRHVSNRVRLSVKDEDNNGFKELNPEGLQDWRESNRVRLSVKDEDNNGLNPEGLQDWRESRAKMKAERWKSAAKHGEEEATVLCTSFLFAQFVVFHITGHLLPVVGDHVVHSDYEINYLGIYSGVFVLIVVVLTIVRTKLKKNAEMLDELQEFFAMSMSWTFFRFGDWAIRDFGWDSDLTKVINAFVMTVVSVVVIIIIDKFADNMIAVENVEEGIEKARLNSSRSLDNPTSPSMAEVYLWASMAPDYDPEQLLRDFFDIAQDPTNMEKALRSIIHSIALLVGVCWEKAIDACDETLVYGTHMFHTHPVWGKVLVGGFLTFFVLPAWVLYIVPQAEKTPMEFTYIMKKESELVDAKHGQAKLGNSPNHASSGRSSGRRRAP